MTQFKGSKKKILDLVESPTFIKDINQLIKSTGATVAKTDKWKPIDKNKNYKEEFLHVFLKDNFSPELAEENINWWFKHKTVSLKIASWNMISTCTINNKNGILLVAGRCQSQELHFDSIAKLLLLNPSVEAIDNHNSIIKTIENANSEINKSVEGVSLSASKCYKLSNHVSQAWWLASKGIPVVLLYLGFLNVEDLPYKKNTIFSSDEVWKKLFTKQAAKVGIDKLIDKKVDCGAESFITICKSM